MLSFLLAFHFLIAILIIGLVFIQKHEADGVLGTGGSGAGKMFSARGEANILTRATAILMTLFFINCLIMAKIVKHTPRKESLLDVVAKETAKVEEKNSKDKKSGTDSKEKKEAQNPQNNTGKNTDKVNSVSGNSAKVPEKNSAKPVSKK
ncbi:MAG: preprotein translocase subunit SecG [Alphaproteobacteria bacterium]|nr:preprotein translocase subunit SecG [Alphaproteobacteria bacterium]